jgi:hypothetical protein
MPCVGFEPTIPASVRAKTVHSSDRSAIVTSGMYVEIHIFLTSALVGGEWSASRPCRFTPEERAPGTHWIGGWVGPRAGLEFRMVLTVNSDCFPKQH